ncbi:MAG TPA: ABC transporter permease, partial [Blastocatellia bacterium]|nr:ABC transporter permease [Blastocatellia bacterium]
ANTSVFTVINSILLRMLPIPNPNELVVINGRIGGNPGYISFPMYLDLRAQQQVFTDMMASAGETPVRLTIPDGGEVDNVRTSFVTPSYFGVLGVQPAIGRFFTEDEDRDPDSSEKAGSLAVLSYSFWERQFGLDPAVIGRTVLVNRSPCQVIGVTERGFFGEAVGSSPDLWVPIISFTSRDNLENRRGAFTAHMGRLKPGVSLQQAQTAMSLLYQQLRQAEYAQTAGDDAGRPISIQLEPGGTGISYGLRRTFERPLWIIMAIVAAVLMIASANVANLLLARATVRQREIGVRLALGCSRSRLIRQLLTESLLLSAAGTVLGIIIAWWGSGALLGMIDTRVVPLRINLSPDASVLLFTAAVMIVTGVVFGLVPAVRASSVDLTTAMKEQARGGTSRRVKHYLGRTLVAVQVALSLMLLIGSTLLIRSIHNLHGIDLGFRPEQVLIFDLAHDAQDRTNASLARAAREVEERVRQVPGVKSMSVSGLMLFSPSDIGAPVRIHGYEPQPGEDMSPRFNSISPGYFETVGMTLVAGRGIEPGDSEQAPTIAVINEAMARRYFAGRNPLGQTMEITAGRPVSPKPIEIVGIIRDAKYNDLRAETEPMFYMSIQQLPRSLRTLEVRTAEPISVIAGPVRNALLEVTKEVMVRRVVTLSAQVDRTLAGEQMITTLCSFFGLLALLLACVGLYGVISYAVAQRTKEIGIRMALGASRQNVLLLVLRQSLTVVLAGIVTGVGLAFVCTRWIAAYLYGLSPTDPVAILLAAVLLAVVALLACVVPARRASKVDPIVALRFE